MRCYGLFFFALSLATGAGLMTGACSVPLAVSGAGYAADGALLAATDKSSSDHMISMVSKQDCALWRVVRKRAVCKPREGDADPYKVDYDDPQRTVAEDGVHYAPPLRTAPDAPPASWDAGAYRPGPAPPTAPRTPVTAVAQGSEDPQPVVAAAEARPMSSPAAKPKRPTKRSIKKPSRRPAAPAS